MTENNNRVCCLYRVSTDKQVDFNSNHEADLPMQRKACHKFAESKGWVIVHEEQEEGVSGHKVRAAARDKLQIIKDYARKGKFDILLVFMFDRIGRIADETPFIVEWFVRNGIRVWSTQEGEQRFDNHTDKLLNYIRFWQADGESEKTSIRTRTSLRQLVEEGHFKGGNAPYGYDLVRSGRINKRKHELYELHINEQEAAVVRIVFDKYVYTRSTSRSTSISLLTLRGSDTSACKTVGHRTSIFRNNETARIGGCRPCACKIRHLDDFQCDLQESKKKSTVLQTKYSAFLVENSGIEPLTSCMPCKRSPS